MRAKAKTPGKIERRLAYTGITATARRLGCSREHLSRVLHGKRKASPNIALALRHMGVKVEVA